MQLTKRNWALFLALALPAPFLQASDNTTSSQESTRPNVVLIVLDDLGYNDLGFQGLKEASTPNIDKIANQGVRFTQAYVTCPVCSPTRAGLITGQYQQKFGHEFNPGSEGSDKGLPTNISTLPELLKPEGYRTIAVGKWHLGNDKTRRPNQRGFDDFFGFLGGAHHYYNWAPNKGGVNAIRRNDTIVSGTKYLTTAFGEEAAAYIDDSLTKDPASPFFLYLAFNAVHTPMHAPQNKTPVRKEDEDNKTYRRRVYLEMLKSADEAIGKVQEAVNKNNADSNTLYAIISDNGGASYANEADNTPLRGTKGTVWEGGIRVPLAIKWTGSIPSGQEYTKPVSSLDLFPTILAVAGITPPSDLPLDGVNLIPYIKGQNDDTPHDKLFWRWGQYRAIRSGEWKLLSNADDKELLFHIENDPSESQNLAEQEKDVVARLKSEYEAWNSTLKAPLWRRDNPPKKKR